MGEENGVNLREKERDEDKKGHLTLLRLSPTEERN